MLRSARREASCSLVSDLKAAVQSQLLNAGKAAALIGASALLAGVRKAPGKPGFCDGLQQQGALQHIACNDSQGMAAA